MSLSIVLIDFGGKKLPFRYVCILFRYIPVFHLFCPFSEPVFRKFGRPPAPLPPGGFPASNQRMSSGAPDASVFRELIKIQAYDANQ
jgi:hypothetical protein